MRWFVLLAVLAAASPARGEMIIVADDPAPRGRGLALAVSADLTAVHIHGFQAGAFGADFELGWRRGALELYGAADVGLLQFWPVSTGATGIAGRLGGGIRWHVRGGRGEDFTGMILQLGAGYDAFAWDGAHVIRPDVDLGIGYEIISETWRFRVVSHLIGFSDDNRNGIACRGCVTQDTALDVGLGMTMGVAW